nr:hypothetical protein [Tanacetum cinerariifolium]
MNDFCLQKGIKREFSNARTPQQNGVAERKNRTLIEAARTMLADAKLLVTFWAEAVNTACYVQNRVLVNKSQNKTPYELFNGRTPAIGFLEPFGYHVMILNTIENLGKFEAKEDEGYFIGYSMSSKAFRVFNKRTRRVEENLHVEFLENKAIEKGAGLNWLFEIDSLTKSMNYVPVDAGTNSTNISGTKDAASQEVKKDVSFLRYIALPNWVHDALLESSLSKPQDDCSSDVPESSGNTYSTATSTNPPADQLETLTVETPISTVSSPVLTACFTDSSEPSSDTRIISKRVANQVETPSLDNILTLTNQFEDILEVTTNSVDSDGVEADVSNMETTITASPTPTLRIHKDHPKSQIIGPGGVRPIGTKWVLKNKKDERGIVIRNKARLVAQGHGPTSVSSISHKWYCLVVIDDFSRFTWTFFLRFKDETSDILKKFTTEIENLKDYKVKIIRCDNGGEFRNKEMNDFCSQKGIKREFSNTRTPQQNGVAERRNRTLIEAARTMLANAKLPVTFWAEAVNTACYVQNRVLVNKSQNKTPYKLFNGRTPTIGFLKPFDCHVMILNTLDNLGKFEAKGDEEFLENRAIEQGAGPNWLFDIDSLTKSMNYVPMDAGTNSTNLSGIKDAANQEVKKNESSLRYIVLPNWAHDALSESTSSKLYEESSSQVPEGSGNPNPIAFAFNPPANQMETLTVESPIPTVSSSVPTACLNDSLEPSGKARLVSKRVANQEETPSLDNIISLTNRFEDILRVSTSLDEIIGVEADVSNMETSISASPTLTLRIHKDHPKSQIIGPVDTLI